MRRDSATQNWPILTGRSQNEFFNGLSTFANGLIAGHHRLDRWETSLTDAESHLVGLIQRARVGDASALGELLDEHRDYLRLMAERQLDRRLARRLDASDLVQQTCLSVHKKIGEFDGEDVAEFVAWLRQIHERNIINAARDHVQAKKRVITRESPFSDEAGPGIRQTSPSRHAMRSEEKEGLRKALEHLPDDEREALRLRYFEGLGLTEIATQMGLTKDGLVWLLKRAMKNVRRQLPADDVS
ncbi:MAG: RNA polymerase subunit sigma-70 [Planctomycetaceae bacterium]|nr:RNA polymerase subunit sigma-70 [Planctomycetaceae bacterium]